MRRDYLVGILVGGASLPAGVALMAAPQLFLDHPSHQVLQFCVFGGLALTALMFLAAIGIALRDEESAKRRGQARPMLAIVGMAVFGIGFIACAAWYFWPTQARITPAQEPAQEIAEKIDTELQGAPAPLLINPPPESSVAHVPSTTPETQAEPADKNSNVPSSSQSAVSAIFQEPRWPTRLKYVGLTPDEFLDLFKNRTYDQKQKTLSLYKGEWIKVEGYVAAAPFIPSFGDSVALFVSTSKSLDPFERVLNVSLDFKQGMMKKVLVIKSGTKIRAVGQVGTVMGDSVLLLENARIVSETP